MYTAHNKLIHAPARSASASRHKVTLLEAWRMAHDEVLAAYDHWSQARMGWRAEAHCVYVAASDREAATAHAVLAADGSDCAAQES
jgi:hypothetical protein